MKIHPLVPDDLWEAIEPLLPEELPMPQGGPVTRSRSRRLGRHHLRPAHGLSLAAAAAGTGLREWRHLLAPPARLAGRRRLVAAS